MRYDNCTQLRAKHTVTTESKPSLYFVNAPVDFLFVGGASIVTFFAILLFYTPSRTPEVISLAVFLMWIINWPHFSMSTHRLYQSRANVEQYPFTAIVIPFIVIGGAVLSFVYPLTVAPYFVKLFMIWSPYHFSGQTVGVTLIYARRAGLKVGLWERRVLSGFIFGTFFLSTIRAEASRSGYQYYGIDYPSLGVPQWAVTASEWGMWLMLVAFVVVFALWCWRTRRLVPLIVLTPAAAQYIWFVQSVYVPSFQEFVPMFHSLQYILIAWGIQMKERLELSRATPSRKFALSETSRWTALNFAGGVGLFYVLPKFAVFAGAAPLVAEGVVAAAVQIHHFFVDGVIWKLRNQTVSHPLMMNVRDVLDAPRVTSAQPEPVR